MRLCQLAVRGFRNLADGVMRFPPGGVALLGDNGQGKTNLLEAIYYPVFFRSFHGAGDQEIGHFGGPGFGVEASIDTPAPHAIGVRYSGRKKLIEVDGVAATRLADHVGTWLAVAFLPQDLRLADGPASGRRRFLDRMLAIADRHYYLALAHYRAALAQRNAALRQGRPDLARAFDEALARAGSRVVASRLAWVETAREEMATELAHLGERESVDLAYGGRAELADPAGWAPALDASEKRDRLQRNTGIGPHRDDLRINLAGHPAREYGSTGQQRSVAIALKLIELATLARSRGAAPALLLDDVFAELDIGRQRQLARRLLPAGERQIFLTSPREDELPPNLELPVWRVSGGVVSADRIADR